MSRSLCLLLVVISPLLASAYPTFWADDVLPNDVLKGEALTPTNCIKHPTTKEKKHGAPTPDRAIRFTVVEAGKKAPVRLLCPGVPYTVTVGYSEARRTLLTTTVGEWDKGNASCPGLTFTPKSGKSALTYDATLTLPCNATGTTLLEVTSASAPTGAFRTSAAKMAIAKLSDCPTSTCSAENATLASNATANSTLAGNTTANETMTDDAVLPGANATDAENATAVDAANATEPVDAANATEPADAANATGAGAKAPGGDATKGNDSKAAEPAKPTKSAGAASNPASLLAAAAAVMAMGAILL